MIEASERSIAYQSAFKVVFDFQAPTAYRYLATSSARLLPLPLPHLTMFEAPSCALREGLTHASRNIVAPKLHRTGTKRFTPTLHL